MKMRRRCGFGKAEGEVKSSSFVVMVGVPWGWSGSLYSLIYLTSGR